MSEHIIQARKFLVDEKFQEALDCYVKANEEDKDNPESNLFVFGALFSRYIDSGESNENKAMVYCALSESLVGAIKKIAESDNIPQIKDLLMVHCLGQYLPVVDYAIKNPIFAASKRIQMTVTTLYAAGNAIEESAPSNPEFVKTAAVAWKKAVALQQQFYAYSYDGHKAEDYAKKIQTVEPSYVMPTKAGCISKG